MNRIERLIYIIIIIGMLAFSSVSANNASTEMKSLKASVDALTIKLGELNLKGVETDLSSIKDDVIDIRADVRGLGIGSPIVVKIKGQ